MSIRTIFKVFRANEWWGYKIPGILAVGYATSVRADIDLMQVIPSILFVLLSIIVGAIYVSAINDLTDIQEDLKSGKSNRMAKVPARYRFMIPFSCIAIGSYFFYSYLSDTLSAILYLLPWISFSLYSFKPVRLKQRGVWGLLADAAGAHVFISLLMVGYISYVSGKSLDTFWLFVVGVWSLLFGLRGILWHQFYDRDNDLKVQSTTFATGTTPERFKIYERILFILELAAFAYVLQELSLPILNFSLIAYCVLIFLRYKILGQKLVLILNPKNAPAEILLLDFYQVFFPIGLLVHISMSDETVWFVLFIHLILFPGKLLVMSKDFFVVARTIFRKAYSSYHLGLSRRH